MEKSNDKILALINLLELTKIYVKSPETNLLYSRFDSIEEILNEIDNHIHKLKNEDFSTLDNLILLFLPTSDIQEISLDNGWGNLFLAISEKFDKVIKDLTEEYNLQPFS